MVDEPDAAAVPPELIFGTYEIRGVVGDTLTEGHVYQIGLALGSEAAARDQQRLVVGRDGRRSSSALAEALVSGLTASGRDVIDIGEVPIPLLYFAIHHLKTGSGAMLTGSHHPADHNGMKMVLGGQALAEPDLAALRKRILDNDLTQGDGGLEVEDIASEYIRRVTEDIPVMLSNTMKIVLDCGNGVTGGIAPQLYRALGHDIVELYCEVDGDFPNHPPNPSQPDNLNDLIEAVRAEEADLGLAFDGDGDCLGVVDNQGDIIWPDRQMMLYAQDVFGTYPGRGPSSMTSSLVIT